MRGILEIQGLLSCEYFLKELQKYFLYFWTDTNAIW